MKLVIATLVVSTSIAPAFGQAIIAPTSATASAEISPIVWTIDQSGLSTGYTSGVTNFDSYIASNPTHSYPYYPNEWFGAFGSSTATVTYNFGSLVTIDKLALWNEDASGFGAAVLSSSLDGITFTSFATISPANNAYITDYAAQLFSFGSVSGQYVRFDLSGCPQSGAGSYDGCAIGEVAFRAAPGVPEPASWALMVGGFGMIGGAMRSRRKAAVSFG